MRSGLYVTPVNWHLTTAEVTYLLEDSGARIVFFSTGLRHIVEPLLAAQPNLLGIQVGGSAGEGGRGVLAYEDLMANEPTTRIDAEVMGGTMFYSSGTTGRPKGIKAPLSGGPPNDGTSVMRITAVNFGAEESMRFLNTGPLYHAAPALWSAGMQTVGATVVAMGRFDAAASLALLDDEQITTSQWVPTMFRRLLRLPEGVRASYRGEAHKTAWHAAAPCPIELKRAMLDWWGPIINEYYSGSEGGGTIITGPEWLEHPGSVGQHWSGGITHVLDAETFEELPPRKEGLIYFDVLPNYRFAYHNDPGKTEQSYHGDLMTLGDIGFVDEVGYLYLTDRRSDTIVSGGVNIYPREIEEVLLSHPAVHDVAVFGIPDEEFGERVLACVQAPSGVPWDAEVERELDAYCRQNLAGFKCPREYRSVEEMPRDPNGKLYKRRLRDPYWEGHASRVI